MFGYDPAIALAGIAAPVTVLVALAAGDPAPRLAELRRAAEARAAAGRSAVRVTGFPGGGHNLVRYRPAEVAAAILASAG
jgi:pimeloyl-ACP methyl ester carboxylesterase